ncbi:cytochrome P450 2M1-like [Tigriopus californicus]|uniref:cytochrome P450 2M1-like n=1 Tax=Tigriopus californicus TaxID=6832 RepID=UPI0027D9D1FD|nr:cytochrome P450 2M1-like [Tigriopus californicus]
MSAVLVAFATFFVICLVKYWKKNVWDLRHLRGPSPWTSFPIVGHAWMLGEDIPAGLEDLANKYGPVFRFDLGDMPTVIISGYEELVDACKMNEFNGRSWGRMPFIRDQSGTDSKGQVHGVGSSNGSVWVEQRKLAHVSLNKVGMGKLDAMEEMIGEEARTLCDRFAEKAKLGPVEVKGMLPVAVNNVIWRMITGRTTKQDDPFMNEMTKQMDRHFKFMSPSSMISTLMQYFHRVTKVAVQFGFVKGYQDFIDLLNNVRKQIKDFKAVEDGNFVEQYRYEIAKASPESSFYGKDGENHLVGQALDFFIAGTETTTTFLEWTFKYLINYPKIQEKLAREIETVFGSGLPTLSKKDQLHYTQAFILESYRHNPMGILSIPRMTMSDVTLNGIPIPKHTQIFPYFKSMNRDPKAFEDPDEFRPERFLDKNGKFVNNDRVIFFGRGKRKCVGEVLAKAEIFLFLTYFIHTFKMVPVPGEDYSSASNPGLVFSSFPFKVELISR